MPKELSIKQTVTLYPSEILLLDKLAEYRHLRGRGRMIGYMLRREVEAVKKEELKKK